MRVISLRQPWAHLMACGLKPIETRTWATSYRGPLAIHAAKGWDARDVEVCRIMAAHGLHLPVPAQLAMRNMTRRGYFGEPGIVGVVRVTDCVPMTRFHVTNALSRRLQADRALALWAALFPGDDDTASRFAWLTTDAVRFRQPVPYVGGLGLRGTTYRIGHGAPLEDAGPAIRAALG